MGIIRAGKSPQSTYEENIMIPKLLSVKFDLHLHFPPTKKLSS